MLTETTITAPDHPIVVTIFDVLAQTVIAETEVPAGAPHSFAMSLGTAFTIREGTIDWRAREAAGG